LAPRELQTKSQKLSLDRFFLVKGWREGIAMVCYAYSYGVLATYLAIYGKERLGIIGGSGLFFMILSAGLILSRLICTRTLRQGKIVHNATLGICISVFGYILFASVAKPWAFYGSALIIGLGNGHMFPAFQNMFINLAPHSQRGTANSTLLTSWDVGMGLGIVVGGALSEAMGYGAAFYSAAMVNMFGVIYFFWQVKGNYLRNRLR
jgi:predicted MFS family arabinose efflux permease